MRRVISQHQIYALHFKVYCILIYYKNNLKRLVPTELRAELRGRKLTPKIGCYFTGTITSFEKGLETRVD
jgi:hypothetical protein